MKRARNRDPRGCLLERGRKAGGYAHEEGNAMKGKGEEGNEGEMGHHDGRKRRR